MVPLGTVLRDRQGIEWIYIGYRKTSIGTVEKYFHRAVAGVYLDWVYHASSEETIKKRFPDYKIEE